MGYFNLGKFFELVTIWPSKNFEQLSMLRKEFHIEVMSVNKKLNIISLLTKQNQTNKKQKFKWNFVFT